jgi:hypothetical protein
MDTAGLVQTIHYVVAPAVMVSSAALLLLGLQAKFSNLANRFRGLHQERRSLSLKAARDAAEEERLRSVREQVEFLLRRAAYVKRAILLAYAAIACFVGTSVLIFFSVFAAGAWGRGAIAAFVCGLACVLASAVVMIGETRLLYKALTLERSSC